VAEVCMASTGSDDQVIERHLVATG
jgi:hypothetical protein